MGANSTHYLIAYLACETGIAPSALLGESERMLYTMQMYLKGKAEAMNKRR